MDFQKIYVPHYDSIYDIKVDYHKTIEKLSNKGWKVPALINF